MRLRGRKIGKDELVAAFEAHPVYSRQEKVRIDVLKRFGVYSTESNGHLSEYLPWYRKRPDEIAQVDRHVRLDPRRDRRLPPPLAPRTRNWFETEFPQFLEEAGKPIDPAERSNEHASHIIGGAGDRPRLSRPFQRQEQRRHHQPAGRRDHRDRPASSTASASTWSPASRCREACAATCIASINVQRMSVHAAITGDLDLLKLAVLHDPLVGAICTPDEVWQMVDEMVVAQAEVVAAICRMRSTAPRSGWPRRR